jgi:hypothetical protein
MSEGLQFRLQFSAEVSISEHILISTRHFNIHITVYLRSKSATSQFPTLILPSPSLATQDQQRTGSSILGSTTDADLPELGKVAVAGYSVEPGDSKVQLRS